MELLSLKAALAFYAAATALAFVYLSSKDEAWSLWMLRLLSAGLCLHLIGFALRLTAFWAMPENRFFLPINSFFGALSYLSLAAAFFFFYVEREHHLGILGAFVLPPTVIGTGLAVFSADASVSVLAPDLRSYWMNLHPMLLMTAYAALGNAFGVGLALLLQEYQVKSRKPSALCYRLPSLEELDTLEYRLIAVAFPVLLIGILMGGVWASRAWESAWGADPKVIWSLVTAAIYGAYLSLRHFRGLRGRKAVYLSMVGFASVVFTFVAVNFLSGLHGYLSNG